MNANVHPVNEPLDRTAVLDGAIAAITSLGDLSVLPPRFADTVASFYYYKACIQLEAEKGGPNWVPRQILKDPQKGMEEFIKETSLIQALEEFLPKMLDGLHYWYARDKSAGEFVEAHTCDTIEFNAPPRVLDLPLFFRKPILQLFYKRRFRVIPGIRNYMITSLIEEKRRRQSSI